MKNKTKKRTIIILVIVIIITIFLPSIKLLYNQTMHREFIEKVANNSITANIKIIQLTYESGYNSTSTGVSAGASGVIFHREDNKYFALTANHVIAELEGVDRTEIIAMGFDDIDFDIDKFGSGVANHYKQFPVCMIEYTSEKYDLAVISFVSDEEYAVLPLAESAPKYGNKVASMSNPYGERNIVTAGRIKSKKNWNYEDESGKFQYQIMNHSALTSAGSSGSALLNKDLEIVGINLGGNENLFRQFVSGMAIPIDQVHVFLEEWNGNTFP
jgi:S1-C subfamily serine protease